MSSSLFFFPPATYGCSTVLAPFTEKTNLCRLSCLCSFVNTQLTMFMWGYFWALCSVQLTSVSIFSPIPSYLDYCSLEVGWCDSSNFVLLSCFGYSRSFSSSYKFWSHFVKIYELTWWELDWHCIGISRIDILTILNLLIHKYKISLHLFISS